jgi:hypothetical protein
MNRHSNLRSHAFGGVYCILRSIVMLASIVAIGAASMLRLFCKWCRMHAAGSMNIEICTHAGTCTVLCTLYWCWQHGTFLFGGTMSISGLIHILSDSHAGTSRTYYCTVQVQEQKFWICTGSIASPGNNCNKVGKTNCWLLSIGFQFLNRKWVVYVYRTVRWFVWIGGRARAHWPTWCRYYLLYNK